MEVGAGGLRLQLAQEMNRENARLQENNHLSKKTEQVPSIEPGTGVKPSSQQVIKAVEQINNFLTLMNTHLQFKIHDETKQLMVKVVNEEGEVIREIPPEKIMEMLAKMRESLGMIMDCYI